MKMHHFGLFTAMVLTIAFTGPPAMAQTTDGTTPANEGVCDGLKADSITKGLYGLCVAFCEAQDITSIDEPITEEELAALESAAPSGRILANYNKKKTETDPPMPCIRVANPCPCWTEAELTEIDSVMWDGSSSQSTLPYEPNGTRCADVNNGSNENILAYEISRGSPNRYTHAEAFESFLQPNNSRCRFIRNFNDVNGGSTQTLLTFGAGTLTRQGLDACKTSLRNFQTNSGFCQRIDQ